MRNLALTALVLLIAVSFAQANLIVDNSFETDTSPDYGDGSSTNGQWYRYGSGVVAVGASPAAEDGSYSFRTSARNTSDNEYGMIYQFMDGSNIAQGETYTIDGYTLRRATRGQFRMRVWGWTGTPVINNYGDPTGGTYDVLLDTGNLTNDSMNDAWFKVSDTFSTAEDYDQIEVLFMVNYVRDYSASSGSYGCWDNVSLTPEPATMGLLGIGGLVMLRRRNRK